MTVLVLATLRGEPVERFLGQVAGMLVGKLADVEGGLAINAEVQRSLQVSRRFVGCDQKKRFEEMARGTLRFDGFPNRRKCSGRI